MRRLFYKVIAVFIIVFIVDFAVGFASKKFNSNLPDKSCTICLFKQSLLDKKADMLILGASSANNHYIAQLLTDSLDMDVYNAGMGGYDIIYCYLMLEAFLERETPHYVVIDVRDALLNGSGLSRTNDLRPFYNISKSITNYYDNETSWQQRVKMKSNLYLYNRNLAQLLGVLLTKEKTTTNGYIPLSGKMDSLSVNFNNSFKINEREYYYLQKITKICNDKNIKLIISKSPQCVHNVKFDKWINRYCEQNDIVLIDEEYDNHYYKHPEWFNGLYHLNKIGANEFTNNFLIELRKIL